MNTLAYSGGPGPWILLFPLIWAAVVVTVVTVLRRTGGAAADLARGACAPFTALQVSPANSRPSPCSAVVSRRARSTRTSTGDGSPCWTSSSAVPVGEVPRDHHAQLDRHRHRRPRRRRREDLRHGRDRGQGPGRGERRLPGRPLHRDHGALRFRQVHPDALRRRTRHPHLRFRPHRRHRPQRARRPQAHSAAPAARRLRLPGLQPDPHPHGRREHHPPHGPRGRAR